MGRGMILNKKFSIVPLPIIMIIEYKLTIHIDDKEFQDIDIPYYSGPYSDWLKNKMILALHGKQGAPISIHIDELKDYELAAMSFANSMVKP